MLLSRKSKKKQRIIHYRYSCRICKNPNLIKILDLGKLPLAGSFVKKKDKNKIEIKIQLDIHYCDKCKLIQVKNFVDPQYIFQKYNYSSSQIFSLNEHFKN